LLKAWKLKGESSAVPGYLFLRKVLAKHLLESKEEILRREFHEQTVFANTDSDFDFGPVWFAVRPADYNSAQ